jgi:hypothetical protein
MFGNLNLALDRQLPTEEEEEITRFFHLFDSVKKLLFVVERDTNQFRMLPGALNDLRNVNSSLNMFINSRPHLVAQVFTIPLDVVVNEVVKFICRTTDHQLKLTMALVSKQCYLTVNGVRGMNMSLYSLIMYFVDGEHSCRNLTAVSFNLRNVTPILDVNNNNTYTYSNPTRNQSPQQCGFINTQGSGAIFLCRHHVNNEVTADVALHNFDARLSNSLIFWSTSLKGEGRLHLKYGCCGALYKTPKNQIRTDLVGTSIAQRLNLCNKCQSLLLYSPYINSIIGTIQY